jgi:superfamily II DNA/RNA helicase
LFLASATLTSARKFAATLLSLKKETEIVHIEDSTKQEIDLIPVSDVSERLSNPPSDGLLRIVLLLNGDNEVAALLPFMGSEKHMGSDVNVIYFSQIKFHSRMLKRDLKRATKRVHTIYDADLTPKQRREMERQLNDPAQHGITVLATNALELGVDIEGLDVCFIDQIPPSRTDLLQRIGRVGRRANRPGLALLGLSAKPHDQHILEDPIAAFRLDLSRALPIPLHLDMLRWRHALAAFKEWINYLNRDDDKWTRFNTALESHFSFSRAPRYKDLKKQFEDSYGTLVDMGDKSWVHKGFRATASQGKIPLREGDLEVARIEDIAIFRDAHPEAVYLCHDSRQYRVVDYEGDWKVARWEHPESDAVLGKWLRSIEAVQVKRERKAVITRGSWEECFSQYEIKHLKDRDGSPEKGCLEFGVWDYVRKWQGYTEINLA